MIIDLTSLTVDPWWMAGLKVIGMVLLGRLGWVLIDRWVESMRRPAHRELLDEYADMERLADSLHDDVPPYVGFDDPPEIAPEDEPSWPGKVSPPERHLFALVEQPVVAGGDPARFDLAGVLNDGFGNPYPADTPPETPAETSGRHALTESMPAVVDDDEALAVVAAVSGQDAS